MLGFCKSLTCRRPTSTREVLPKTKTDCLQSYYRQRLLVLTSYIFYNTHFLTAALSWVLPATDAKNGQTPTSANSTVHVHWCILLKPGLLPSLSFYCAAVAPLLHLAFVTVHGEV